MTSSSVTHSEDRRPRIGRNSRGTLMFWHPCKVCGLINAGYGYNVYLKSELYGDWYCAEHRPDEPQSAMR